MFFIEKQFRSIPICYGLFALSLILKSLICVYLYDPVKLLDGDSPEYIYFGSQFSMLNIYPYFEAENHYLEVGPVVPIIYALLSLIFSSPEIIYAFINCFLTASIPFMLFLACKSNIALNKISIFVFIWAFFYTDYFRFNHLVNKEPLVYFLFALMFLLYSKIYSKCVLNNIIYFSIIVIFLSHTDPRYFFFIPFFSIPIFIICLKNKKLKLVPIYIFSILILNIPMILYNYINFKEIIFVTPQTISVSRYFYPTKLDKYNFDFLDRYKFESISNINHIKEKDNYNLYYQERYDNALLKIDDFANLPYKYDKFEKIYKGILHYWQPLFINYSFLYDGFRPQKWSLRHNISSMIFYGVFLPFYFMNIYLICKSRSLFTFFLFCLPLLHCISHVYIGLSLERYRAHINFLIVINALMFMRYLAIKYYKTNLLSIKNFILSKT